jgi:hypothetical protein
VQNKKTKNKLNEERDGGEKYLLGSKQGACPSAYEDSFLGIKRCGVMQPSLRPSSLPPFSLPICRRCTIAVCNGGSISLMRQRFHQQSTGDFRLMADRQHRQTERYPGHLPTSPFQKGLLAMGSAIVGLCDPHRGMLLALVSYF